MATISDYFQNAELSVAAYANLQQGMLLNQYIAALSAAGMSATEAREFVGVDENGNAIPGKGYEIVGQLPNTNSGFSATVFRRNGEYFLAIRGTESPFTSTGQIDWSTNFGDIGANGIAIDQALDLFNYFQDLTAQAGSTVYHYAYIPVLNQIVYNSFTASSTGALFGHGFTVTGHSLGGHLSLIMSRLAPNLVGPVYSYNAPGFDTDLITPSPFPGSEGFFTLLRDAEMSARGASSIRIGSWDTVNLHNLVVPEDIVHLIGYVPGVQLSQFSELGAVGRPINSHDKNAMTDALAVYSLFALIDPAKTDMEVLSVGANILKAAASTADATLEAVANALGDLFAAGTKIDIGNRDELYQRLIDLDTVLVNADSGTLKPQYQGLSLVDLAGNDAVTIEANAYVDLGYRYGLRQLNPFAVVGNNDLYVPHNANGELDLYNIADRTGTLTAGWITDRANLLYAEIIRNTQDNPDLARLPDSGDRVTEYHYYRGGKEELFFAQYANWLPNQFPTEVVMFADDSGRSLIGTDFLLGDRLYGGASTDYLEGKAGQDSLEGGRGLDIYNYNISRNLGITGVTFTGDGADIVRDIDGKGVLRVTRINRLLGSVTDASGTVIVDASVKLDDSQWQSADAKFNYIKVGADLVVTINGDGGGTFTLKDFRDGDFGIHLWEARSNPDITGATIPGDLQPKDFDPNTDGIQTQTDALGNVIVTDNPEPDRVDVLNDSTGNDRIIAGGGNDILRGIRGGDDWMSGETGRDNLTGGAGADLIEGGADGVFDSESGGDIAFGDVGTDELYADTKIALAQAITQGNGAASNAKGDYLSGGGDDDWIVGAAGDDYLDGGSGQDLIVSGAGSDNIAGDFGFAAISPLWIIAREITPQDDVTLYTLNFVSGSVSGVDGGAGAADVIYAGAGTDWVFAGEGDDFVDGGAGDDVAFGMEGDDVIIGGLGGDILVGDNGPLLAVNGNDYLDGGEGNDQLEGNSGNDVLIGGTGNDELVGGTGKDIYVFNKGDGTETVFDDDTNPTNPDASVLVLGDDVSQSAIKFKTGSLAVDIGPSDPADPNSPHDVIHFGGFNQIDPIASMPLAEIRFGDGAAMSYADILARGFDIDGTEGDDTGVQNLVGTGVTDRIQGFGGNDLLFGFRGDDMLDGGAGVDQILGGPGADTIYGGSEHDEIWGDAESGGIFAPDGSDIIHAGAGNDIVQGNGSEDQIFGDEGSDTLYGDDGADVLDGGADDDFLYGQGYFFVEGIPFLNLFDDGASDTLRGGDGNDYLNAAAGNDVLEGGGGDDNLEAEAGADYIAGGDGNDLLWGDKADSPLADQGDDTLDGGAGTDQLVGYAGNDTYIFGRGYGQDIIFDHDTTVGNIDCVEFAADVTPDDVTAVQSGANLVLAIGGTADALTIANQLGSTADRVEEIRFADGTVLNPNSIPFAIRGTVGNDSLAGTTGADIFEGLAGNDTMSGTAGNDIYRIFRGDGQDVITDFDSTPGNVDMVSYASDILPSEIEAFRSGNNLVLRLSGTVDQVAVTNYFLNDGATPNSVERIRFLANGAIWDVDLIKQMVLTGTTAADTITGYATNDVLSGLGGNDTLNGNAGDDSLDGGPGNDLLQGGIGNDVYLVAHGSGQDTVADIDAIVGNVDKIVYAADILPSDVRAARSGNNLVLKLAGATDQMTVTNYFQNDGATTSLVEQIQFANGTIWDLATIKSMVITPTSGDDAITGYATDDNLSGLAGNDTIRGATGNDTLSGGAGNDNLFGEGGSDIYLFGRGDGQDVIDNAASDGAGTTDVLSFAADILPSDITPTRAGRDLVLSVQGSTDQVRIQNYFLSGTNVVEEIRFGDGTVWNEQTILGFLPPPPIVGTEGNDVLQGTGASELIRGLGGNDTMRGGGGNDTFEGGPGEDTVIGSTGNDTYLFNTGDGGPEGFVILGDDISDAGGYDVLRFGAGIEPTGFDFFDHSDSRGRMLVLSPAGTSAGVYIIGYFGTGHIEEIRFEDGTVWTDQAIAARFPASGTSGNDNMIGTVIADLMNGFDGNDTIDGNAGHDTLDGGPGSDSLFGEDGNDVLIGGTGESRKSLAYDVLRGGNGNDVLISGEKGSDLYGEDGDDILLGSATPDRLVEFGGSNLMAGGASSDLIDLGDHKDLVIGGTGDDVIDGDNSNVNGIYGRGVLAFNKTDDKDSVQRLGSGSTISIGGGTLYANLSLEVQGATLRLKTSNSNYVALTDWYASPANKSVSTLQIVIEGTRDYKPTSTDPINNSKIQTFDFLGLVDAFDAARAAGQTFKVANNLAAYHLSGSDTEAIGGAVAYQYALTGTLDALTYDQMRAVISDPAFGTSAQSIAALAGTAGTATLDTQTTVDSSSETSAALMLAADTTTSTGEESGPSADSETSADQQIASFALETVSQSIDEGVNTVNGEFVAAQDAAMAPRDGFGPRTSLDHLVSPTPFLASFPSSRPGNQIAGRAASRAIGSTTPSAGALHGGPRFNEPFADDTPAGFGAAGDRGEAVRAADASAPSADHEDDTDVLHDEWFARHTWNDDLTLLDEIARGEAGAGFSDSNASIAAQWRRSHAWLNGRLYNGNGEEDNAAGGANVESILFSRDGAAFVDMPRPVVGLRNVAGHDLKSFSGLREGVNILAQS